MAKNLRTKIQDSDTMVIHDVNQAALEKFEKEVGKAEIAKNVREVAEKTVCISIRYYKKTPHHFKMNPYILKFMI